MSRAVLLAVLATLVAAPLAQAAPWTQGRGDAAATGYHPGEGPDWPDVALRVEIPDPFTATAAPPIILEDRILMLVAPHREDGGPQYTGPWAVLSVDRATGELSTFTELPRGEGPWTAGWTGNGAPSGIATDGRTLYVAGNRSVHAVPLEPGGNEWTRDLGPPAEEHAPSPCTRLRLEAEHLTVTCYAPAPDTGRPHALVARMRTDSGEDLWTWIHPPPTTEPHVPTPPTDPEGDYPDLGSLPLGLAVSAPLVVVETIDIEGGTPFLDAGVGQARFAFRGLDADTGQELWSWSDGAFTVPVDSSDDPFDSFDPPRALTGNPAASAQAVYVKTNAVYKLAFGSGESQWSEAIGAEDFERDRAAWPAVALAGGKVYVMSGQTLYQMDVDDPQTGWRTTLNGSRGQIFFDDPIATPSKVYTSGSDPDGTPGPIYAFDVADGSLLWTHLSSNLESFAVGAGLLVYGDHLPHEGTPHTASEDFIVVLGHTPTSPVPVAEAASLYPAVGGSVEVDLSDSEAGVQGPVTKYMAIWGDGTSTDWHDEPMLSHAYDQPGDVTARFIVGNDANQTNSTTMTFHVGGSPPQDPTFLETAFARDNQDMTFGILGIILAIGGTIVGVVARRRHEAHEADRLQAYERVLATEIAEGRADQDLTGRMAPMRAALGVSEKEHARLVEQLMAQRAGTAVALVPGETFLDRYEVLERLGAGGGGTTYLCHDRRIDRQVVIKALHATEQDAAATVREARAFGAVSHENVVALHDVEQVGDRVFLVLEHVPGGSLDDVAEPPAVDGLAQDLLAGLAAVHEAGIVHRDVKPSNILLTAEGGHKLADFGIAHTPGFQTSIGGLGGGAVGTVQYMSPEQAKGREVDHRSDLYSAAVVLWEAYTGEPYMPPAPGETATELQMRIAQADGLPRVPEGASEELAAWFEKALDPDPEARFQAADEMLGGLRAALRASD